MFYITAGIYFVTNLIFILFGAAHVQSWNDPDSFDRPNKSRISTASAIYDPTTLAIPEEPSIGIEESVRV